MTTYETYLLAVGEDFPTIVCLCGSTRFSEAFHQANLNETLKGKIVLSIGCDFKSDEALGLSDTDKQRLDVLHLRKIDIADEILVLNVNDYIGPSTANEIRYAHARGIPIRWLEPHMCRMENCPCKGYPDIQ
ncbi:hypothetical protein [Dictyobacter formicarum]|uniref:Uncharacterized protein n=1 Tax=Dictyobacter formicarum TaxID=2778368 RepID=A0ABQ3VQS6_9CHLR|nr:hypothetical protein [Dictyobacter formicarum]GHO88044.1 hypothetical protein KSZ_60500 [Dictyobacter formicarum]